MEKSFVETLLFELYRHATNVLLLIIDRSTAGGVLVTPEEVQAAFEFLDEDAEGRVSAASLRKRLQVFFPTMTTKDYRVLMNNKKHITATDIIELLENNDVTGFDPVQEAFTAFDPSASGAISIQRLREVFSALGLGELGQTEVDILLRVRYEYSNFVVERINNYCFCASMDHGLSVLFFQVADVDGDGSITLEDFRYMLDLHARNQTQQQTQQQQAQGGRRGGSAVSATGGGPASGTSSG